MSSSRLIFTAVPDMKLAAECEALSKSFVEIEYIQKKKKLALHMLTCALQFLHLPA